VRPVSTKQLRRVLERRGCQHVATAGSHEKWKAPGGHTTILKAAVKTQSPGTARQIQRHLAAEFGPTWLEEDLT
jgi:predicted RNA binding protein YcfA (HicA-like mRNA interferase family)